MSFRNRCRIAGAGGAVDLSVPLERGRDQRSLVKDVRISGSRRWQAEHWKTILSCYSRSPWFEFYRDDLEKLFGRPMEFLMDWNLACFEWSIRVLDLSLDISVTDAFRKTYPEDGWIDRRGTILPRTQGVKPETVALPVAAELAEPPPVVYRQVFEERTGFIPGLSILDLLFCEGKNARQLLFR